MPSWCAPPALSAASHFTNVCNAAFTYSMAELGDFLAFGSYTDQATPSTAPLPQVPVEHLDYEYASKCESIPELQAMLQVLKSGKEGSYPKVSPRVPSGDGFLSLDAEGAGVSMVAVGESY